MDKTTKDQVKIPAESPLWEELPDEAADACVGGVLGGIVNPGDLSGYLGQARRNRRIYRYYFRNT